ncbi:MAG: MaoC family dehydratase N-terminal domain-containing protein [Aliishimia sp.]
MDGVNVNDWVGRAADEHGTISPTIAAQLHATIGDANEAAPQQGDLVPGLWHWCGFPPLTHVSDLGPEGHSKSGALLPPIGSNRRMWAGGGFRFHAPLRVGDPLQQRSSVRSIVEKEGATGPLLLITVDHAISGPEGLAIEERQDIVLLNVPKQFTPPKTRAMPSVTEATHAASEIILFRYSALTFNAHRIHYDLGYVQNVEKYPGLVVHGPLLATLLLRHAVEKRGQMPRHFEFRGVHPLFAGTDLEICSQEDGDALALFAGQNGHQGMSATATWKDI